MPCLLLGFLFVLNHEYIIMFFNTHEFFTGRERVCQGIQLLLRIEGAGRVPGVCVEGG